MIAYSPQIILFAPTIKDAAAEIADWVQDRYKYACGICDHISKLIAERLRWPQRPRVMILLAADHEELNAMVGRAPQFTDSLALLLRIPDHCPQTLAKAHLLRPRYLFGPDSDMRELKTVLKNLFLYHSLSRSETSDRIYPILYTLPQRGLLQSGFLLHSGRAPTDIKPIDRRGRGIHKRFSFFR